MILAVRRLKYRVLTALVIFSVFGCAPPTNSSRSKISIRLPGASTGASSSKAESVSASSAYDFSLACYAVNVKGSDIPALKSAGTCDIPRGIFAGFVAAGGSLTLDVPRGSARSLEIFSFLRDSSTAPCPTLHDFGSLARNKIARVGRVPSFDTQAAEVELEVTISAPAAGVSVVSQYSLPSSCVVTPPPSQGSAGITIGHTRASGGAFVIEGSISGQSNEAKLSGGQFQIHLSRKAD